MQEGPKDGPYRACIKFADVQGLLQRFDERISQNEVTKILRHAFPDMKSERTTCIFGVRLRPSVPRPETSQLPGTPFSPGISVPGPLEAQVQALQSQNSQLQQRMADLEKENRQLTSTLRSAISVSTLDSQISRLLSSGTLICHGADNLKQFEKLSLEAILSEVKSLALTCSSFLIL